MCSTATLDFLNEIYMCQKYLATTVTGEAELLHDFGFLRLGHGSAIKVGALAVAVTLKFLEATLIVEPFIGETLAAVHTPDRNDHLAT